MFATALAMAALMPAPVVSASGTCTTVSSDALDCKFGLDWLIDGTLRQGRELWELHCVPRGEATSCNLTTQIVPIFAENWCVMQHHYTSTNGGGLALHNGRWMEGTLQFDVVGKNGEREVVVAMRFAKDPETQSLELVEFKAKGVARVGGDVAAIELRVPEYTTTVQLPITLPGMHSANAKRDADFRQSLSPPDREAYERFQKSECAKKVFEKSVSKDALRAHCPEAAAFLDEEDTTTSRTQQQKRCMAEAVIAFYRAAMRPCLTDAGLSVKGQERYFATKAFDVNAMVEAMQKGAP